MRPIDLAASKWRVVSLQLLAIAGPILVALVALVALAAAYGFRGDEMHDVVAGQRPAFGYSRSDSRGRRVEIEPLTGPRASFCCPVMAMGE